MQHPMLCKTSSAYIITPMNASSGLLTLAPVWANITTPNIDHFVPDTANGRRVLVLSVDPVGQEHIGMIDWAAPELRVFLVLTLSMY